MRMPQEKKWTKEWRTYRGIEEAKAEAISKGQSNVKISADTQAIAEFTHLSLTHSFRSPELLFQCMNWDDIATL